MNCFNLMCHWSYCTILTSITGTVMLLFWWLFQRVFIKIHPSLIYPLLKLVYASFLVPVVYILMIVFPSGGTYSEGGVPFIPLSKVMEWIFITYSLVCVAYGLSIIIKKQKQYLSFKKRLNRNIEETNPEVIEQFMKIKKQLGVRRPIKIYRNPVECTAMIAGGIRPVIILPDLVYSKKEYEVIFSHELTHYKSKDLYTKMITVLIMVIHCFNPFTKKLLKQTEQWSEINCDIKACENLYVTYSVKEYYQCILEIAARSGMKQKKEQEDFLSALCKEKPMLERRMLAMDKHISAKKYPKWISVCLVFVFVFAASTTAYASSMKAVDLERSMTEKIVVENYVPEEAGDEETEYTLLPEDDTCTNVWIMDEPVIIARQLGQYHWNVPKEGRYVTSKISVKEGHALTMVGYPESKLMPYRMGYVNDDAVITYVFGTGNKSHTFNIGKTEKVRLFVENRSATKVLTIDMSYHYED